MIEIGIDVQMISVERMLRRKMKMMPMTRNDAEVDVLP